VSVTGDTGISLRLAEEGSPLFRTKCVCRGEALILNYLGKRKEKMRIGEKEGFQAQHMRDYWSSLLSRLIQHWSTGSKG
jgi:hypothetical protein